MCSGLEGNGHSLSEIHMSFRYVAGYTPAAGQHKEASVVKLVVLDLKTSKVGRRCLRSFRHFNGA